MHTRRTSEIVVLAITFLFFLQVLSDFIQSIYAFGLLVTAFTIQIASVLLLFTPLLLLLIRKPPSRPWMIGLASVAVLSRLAEPMLDPGGRLVACGISVGAFMLLFPLLIANAGPTRSSLDAAQTPDNAETPRVSIGGWSLASGLLIALSLSILFRAANSSLDLSESGFYQVIAWVLAVVSGWLAWRSGALGEGKEKDLQPPSPPRAPRESSKTLPSMSRVIGLCMGLAGAILMLYFGFTTPTVIARWTGYSYLAIIAVLVVTLTIFAHWMNSVGWSRDHRTPNYFGSARFIQAWNVLFVVMLVLTIVPHQISFRTDTAAYPFDAPAAAGWGVLPLFLMLALSPIIFVDFALYIQQLSDDEPSISQLGIGFALAALFILVMVFLHVFTTIYDYAPVVGPLFRDRFWLVYLLAGVGLALPILLVRAPAVSGEVDVEAIGELRQRPKEVAPFIPVAVGALAILSLAALYVTQANPEPRVLLDDGLRVMTYNIQQGFDKIGNENLQGQLDVIRQVAPDVLGLQESDTARVANGNVDTVRFFADKLDMYSYYGPTTTTGTFGIALLSKFPIQSAHTFFMYSTGEQTAAIQAQIVVNGRTYNVFVTHLGNNGEMVQLQAVLQRVDSLPNVILMGDFNFNPSTPQYSLATGSLADAWLLRWPGGKDIPGLGPEGRIDHIFVSRGTAVIAAEYTVNPASDHPYLYAVLHP